MHFLELADGNPCVELRGIQLLMPQHHLDMADIRPVVQHLGRHRVPEQVTGPRFVQLRLLPDGLRRYLGQVARTQWPAFLRDKQVAAVMLRRQFGPHLRQITRQPAQRPLADRDHPVFIAFALPDNHGTPFDVDIPLFELAQLHAPDAATPEHFQHHPIAQP
ncbi:hypothetical protein Xsze_04380 [Xenorhabdus szentirmaii DSM 16338]|nr:hypothetical protein Xsze_04380 [Xenorhabdus szentirmaii DSM 16338]